MGIHINSGKVYSHQEIPTLIVLFFVIVSFKKYFESLCFAFYL
jgi:hypothetical protein